MLVTVEDASKGSRPRYRWRMGAAVIVVVGLAAAGWLWVGARPDRGGPGGLPVRPAAPLSVWPEDPLDPPNMLQEAQDRVDAGEDRWRLSPRATASRFVGSVLGWDRSIVIASVRGSSSVTFTVGPRCVDEGDCRARGRAIAVTMDRLVPGEGRIWSVVEVHSPRLEAPVVAGAVLSPGQILSTPLTLGRDERAAVGMRTVSSDAGSRCASGFEGEVGIAGPDFDLRIPAPDDCGTTATGYVFAYSTSSVVVQTGDPLLEAGAIDDLTIVPVVVGSAASPSTAIPAGCAPASQIWVSAIDLSFDRDCLAVSAGVPFSLTLDNLDDAESHDLAVYPIGSCVQRALAAGELIRCGTRAGSEAVFTGSTVVGPGTSTDVSSALGRGTYLFICDFHPDMQGRFVVR